MTNYDPSARDELVAAYLDGEATTAERAQVEADPDLMERVAIMGQVAAMVAEPVDPPPLELRQAHIAAAIGASSTAANVTSLAPRRKRWSGNFVGVASAAAVIALVLLAVPLLLLNAGGDDDDSVATSAPADVADNGGDDVATTELAEEEPAEEAAEEPVAELALDAAADDGATAAAEAPAEEPVEEVASEAAEEPAGAATGDLGLLDQDAFAILTGDLSDLDALVDRVTLQLESPETARRAEEIGLLLTCADELAELASSNPALLIGASSILGESVEYVVADPGDGPQLIVVDAATCGTTNVIDLR